MKHEANHEGRKGMRMTRGQAVYAQVRAQIAKEGHNTNVVRWTDNQGNIHESREGAYDALGLAKDLVFNPGFYNVTLTFTNGRILSESEIKNARF